MFDSPHSDFMVKSKTSTDERIARIRTLLQECNTLVDELEEALDSVEKIFPPPEIDMVEVMTGV